MFNLKELYYIRMSLDWLPEHKEDKKVDSEKLRNKISDLITLQKAWNRNKRIDFAWLDDECLDDENL